MRSALSVAALCLVVTAACSNEPTGVNSPVGTYVLVSANNIIVPALTFQNDAFTIEVLSGSFTLSADGTFTETRTGRVTQRAGAVSNTTSTQNGTWSQSGAQLSFVAGTVQAPVNFVATFEASTNTLTYGSGGSTFVYRKAFAFD